MKTLFDDPPAQQPGTVFRSDSRRRYVNALCKRCSTPFWSRCSERRKGGSMYCSIRCGVEDSAALRIPGFIERHIGEPFLLGGVLALEIPLNGDRSALIDASDLDLVKAYRWQLHTGGYAYTHRWKKPCIYMHRLIVAAPIGMEVDHKDGNKLNNTRANLRVVTKSQNMQNRVTTPSNSTVGVRGVSKTRGGRFVAQLITNGKRVYLGSFDTVEEAGKAAAEGRRKHMTHSAECDHE